MSHFVAVVIGDDVEGQLQRYHEFECTGIDDQYVKEIDVTAAVLRERDAYLRDGATLEKALADALADHGLYGDKIVPSAGDVDTRTRHKYGYAIVADGRLVKAVERTNPDKKWDGWTVGGRWGGFFVVKGGGKADVARKRDIDFAGMRAAAAEQAGQEYDEITAVIAGRSVPDWDAVREAHPGDLNTARDAYHADPVVKDLYAARHYFVKPRDYLVPRDAFTERESRRRTAPFAVVCDGRWYEKGKMGWFGITHDERSDDEWEAACWRLIDAAPADALLTAVDCHV